MNSNRAAEPALSSPSSRNLIASSPILISSVVVVGIAAPFAIGKVADDICLAQKSQSDFTTADDRPLIGALLRVPWEAVRARMLTRLRESGFDDFEPAHFTVFRYPNPDGARPSELAARLGISKQSLSYLLRELERLGYLERSPTPPTYALSGSSSLAGEGGDRGHPLRCRRARTGVGRALGARRFAQLRSLLVELNDLV